MIGVLSSGLRRLYYGLLVVMLNFMLLYCDL